METHNINVIACSDLGVQEVRAATHRGPGGSPAALPALMRCYMIPARLPYEEGHRLSESQRPVAIQNTVINARWSIVIIYTALPLVQSPRHLQVLLAYIYTVLCVRMKVTFAKPEKGNAGQIRNACVLKRNYPRKSDHTLTSDAGVLVRASGLA